MKQFLSSQVQASRMVGLRLVMRGLKSNRALCMALALGASAAVHAQDASKAKPAQDAAASEGLAERAGRAIDRGAAQAAQAIKETAVKTGKGLKEGGAKLAAGAETAGKRTGEVAETVVEKTGEGLKKAGGAVERAASSGSSDAKK